MKRFASLLLAVVICISSLSIFVYAERDVSGEEALAQELKELGLFKGVSDTDFDLDRAPSRVEALVMLIRVLGRESEVSGGVWRHPFTDVPEWADKYVGFAYSNGLTNGQSLTEFGTGDASAAMFVTFVLRALGYSDTNGADFVWSDPFTLAKVVGILPEGVNLNEFWRADVVTVAHSALTAQLKGSDTILAEKLISAGCFTTSKFNSCYKGGNANLPLLELTAEQIYKECSGAVFYIETADEQGNMISSGSGFFIDDKGTAVTNYHVVKASKAAKVQLSGSGTIYDVVGIYDYDIKNDWAVIKVNCTGNEYLKIGDASTAEGGAIVYAIGSPLGLQNTISQGLISNPERDVDGVKYIQISAAISSGSSGGALINKYGEVIGITSASYVYGQNLNLAIPMTALEGYTVNNLIAFKDLETSAKQKIAKLRQENAYDLMKAFIIQNYNATRGGDKEYIEMYRLTDTENLAVGISYDEENEEIWICLDYYLNGSLTYMMQSSLDRSKKYGHFYYYDLTHSTPYEDFTYGEGNFSFASFNGDFNYEFEAYSGTADRKQQDQTIAKELQCFTLASVDGMFSKFIGDYSVYDFGYTTFFVNDFRFSKIAAEQANQARAYAVLRNFIVVNSTEFTTDGYLSYTETEVDGDFTIKTTMYYNDDEDFIVVGRGYFYNGATAILAIDFHMDSRSTSVEWLIEGLESDNRSIGVLAIENSDFSIYHSYEFDDYEGNYATEDESRTTAKFMHSQLLDFVNSVYQKYLSMDCSVADFGYTSYNARDFK